MKVKEKQKKLRWQKLTEWQKGHSVRKKVKPVLEKFKQTKVKPRLNKDGTFDKRYLGNHNNENEAAKIIQNAFKNRNSPVKTRSKK